MTHRLDVDDFFIHRGQEQCAGRGLNFSLIEPARVEAFLEKLARGQVWPRVLLDATSEADLARSMPAWPDPHYLLQRRIVPRWLMGLPAYFRVYHVFGSVWLRWWNCFTARYRAVTPAEEEQFALAEANELVVIDCVNDQCHLLTQTASPKMGVPDELVAAIARRLVEGAQALIVNKPAV